MDSLTKKRRRKKKKDVNDERRKVGHNDFNTKLIKGPSYNLSYLTVINSCKNNSINLLQNNIFPNTSRTFKHSKSLNKLNNRPHIKWNLKNKDFRNNSNKGEQLLELIYILNLIYYFL